MKKSDASKASRHRSSSRKNRRTRGWRGKNRIASSSRKQTGRRRGVEVDGHSGLSHDGSSARRILQEGRELTFAKARLCGIRPTLQLESRRKRARAINPEEKKLTRRFNALIRVLGTQVLASRNLRRKPSPDRVLKSLKAFYCHPDAAGAAEGPKLRIQALQGESMPA